MKINYKLNIFLNFESMDYNSSDIHPIQEANENEGPEGYNVPQNPNNPTINYSGHTMTKEMLLQDIVEEIYRTTPELEKEFPK